MNTYRLASAAFVHAPGLIAWAINGAAFPKDRAAMVRIVRETWNLPEHVAYDIVTEELPYTLDGDTVVVHATEDRELPL